MSNLTYHDGPVDESIHLADGSHRSSPPADFIGDPFAWEERRDAHVAAHVGQAQLAAAPLKGVLRDLAVQVAQKTQGMTFFVDSSRVDGITYYEFTGIAGKRDREDMIRALCKVLRQARGL